MVTCLSAAYTWAATTRTERIERLVAERTVEIRRKDEQLRQSQEMKAQAIRVAHEETIHRLVTASLCRDEETGMHIKRTGLLSELLARAAGWSEATPKSSAWPRRCTTWARSASPTPSCESRES